MAIMRDEAGAGIDLDAPVIELFLHLLATINRNDILCCYWKSNRRLPAALMGETDLDLLCSRRDQHRLQECLLATGFKLFPKVSSRSDPCTVIYLG
jgi:hypothetical protein